MIMMMMLLMMMLMTMMMMIMTIIMMMIMMIMMMIVMASPWLETSWWQEGTERHWPVDSDLFRSDSELAQMLTTKLSNQALSVKFRLRSIMLQF